MLSGKEVITGNRQEVWLNADNLPSISAFIYKVENDIFWTNLPRCEGQVLMMQIDQAVDVGVSLAEGFYNATSRLMKVGNTPEAFYGFELPSTFDKTQERQFLRIPLAASVLFRTEELAANSASINFSAGGIMVFLVPELEKIINAGKSITMTIKMGEDNIELPIEFSWKKTYDHIPMAGFVFDNVNQELQNKLTELVELYTKKL